MRLSDEQAEFTSDLCKLITFAKSLGFKVTLGEVERTEYQQAYYVAHGRSKTMLSMHLKKCAGDLNFYKIFTPSIKETWVNGMGKDAIKILEPVGRYWESLNEKNEWGGFWTSFIDIPHFGRRV